MKKILIASVLGASVIAGVAIAGGNGGYCNKGGDHEGWGGRGHHGMMMHGNSEKMLKKMQKRLDLTDDQVTQLSPILENFKKQKSGEMVKRMETRLENMKSGQAELRQQVEGILTPEQLAKFDKRSERRLERMQDKLEDMKEYAAE